MVHQRRGGDFVLRHQIAGARISRSLIAVIAQGRWSMNVQHRSSCRVLSPRTLFQHGVTTSVHHRDGSDFSCQPPIPINALLKYCWMHWRVEPAAFLFSDFHRAVTTRRRLSANAHFSACVMIVAFSSARPEVWQNVLISRSLIEWWHGSKLNSRFMVLILVSTSHHIETPCASSNSVFEVLNLAISNWNSVALRIDLR